MKKLLAVMFLTSCGVKVSGIPGTINGDLGPNFEQAAAFCDNRYGANTAASESCFEDYRDYTKITVSLDLSSIQNFCTTTYANATDQQTCDQDLAKFLEQLSGIKTGS